MIETSRSLGCPARLVNGYLASQNSRVSRGSTGFDPSIGKCVGPGHTAVGVSHHPRGVMPVSGGFNGLSGVGSSLTVNITTQPQPPPVVESPQP